MGTVASLLVPRCAWYVSRFAQGAAEVERFVVQIVRLGIHPNTPGMSIRKGARLSAKAGITPCMSIAQRERPRWNLASRIIRPKWNRGESSFALAPALTYCEQACKPNSVPSRAAAIHLGRTSPHASCVLPGNEAGHFIVPLFGLAPGGV
jgi:hypothetical protein